MLRKIRHQATLRLPGIMLIVTDSGKGFDFNEVVRKKRSGQRYFNACSGNGIFVYDVQMDSHGKIPYQVSGERNRVNIMYKFQPEEKV